MVKGDFHSVTGVMSIDCPSSRASIRCPLPPMRKSPTRILLKLWSAGRAGLRCGVEHMGVSVMIVRVSGLS